MCVTMGVCVCFIESCKYAYICMYVNRLVKRFAVTFTLHIQVQVQYDIYS